MKSVSAAIFLKDNSVLIACRGSKEDLPGHWEFPGGKQEEDETIFECLEREIQEEFGVICKADRIFCESIYTYDQGTIRLIAILAHLTEEDIRLTVHEEYRWVDIRDLLTYNLAPADVPVAKELLNSLQSSLPVGQ